MDRQGRKLVVNFVLNGLFMIVAQALVDAKIDFRLKLRDNINCTHDIYENDETSQAYKKVVETVEDSIRTAFNITSNKYYSNFVSCRVQRITCVGRDVIAGVVVQVQNIPVANVNDFNTDFISIVERLNTVVNATVGPAYREKPALYTMFKVSIGKKYFCKHLGLFKEQLADTLILDDAVSKANPKQVIVFDNYPCHGDQSEIVGNLPFFISSHGVPSQPDLPLTNLAFKIVEQIIYEGTTWRLGLHLYKHIDNIELFGSAKERRVGLTDVQITYTGFGAVIFLLLVILIFILIVKCYNKFYGEDYIEDVYARPTAGVANALFETEEDIAPHDPVFEAPPPPIDSPMYFESEKPFPYHGGAPIATKDVEFDNQEEIQLGNVHQYGYDNRDTPTEGTDEIHAHDTVEKDASCSDGGKNHDVNGLYGMLQDADALIHEYNSLMNDIPDASFYPEGAVAKNRVPECFPWPDNRVLLYVDPENKDQCADYINASFVKDNTGAISYLSTQAPLESTTQDFWQLIWERNVVVIAMVAPVNLPDQEVCFQYWPNDNAALLYGEIQVQFVKKELKQDFHITTMDVSLSEKHREVYLFHYTSWAQGDVPTSSESIVAFALEIRELCDSIQPLPIFHCISGRGMSAVMIALMNGMSSIEEHNYANMKSIVQQLRRDVPRAIETFGQYEFLYKAMYQYAVYNANQ